MLNKNNKEMIDIVIIRDALFNSNEISISKYKNTNCIIL